MASLHSVASRDDRLHELEDRCGYIKRRLAAVLGILGAQHRHDSAGRQYGHDINDSTCEVAQLVEDTLEELQGLAERLEESALALRTGKEVAWKLGAKLLEKEFASADLPPKDGA